MEDKIVVDKGQSSEESIKEVVVYSDEDMLSSLCLQHQQNRISK